MFVHGEGYMRIGIPTKGDRGGSDGRAYGLDPGSFYLVPVQPGKAGITSFPDKVSFD